MGALLMSSGGLSELRSEGWWDVVELSEGEGGWVCELAKSGGRKGVVSSGSSSSKPSWVNPVSWIDERRVSELSSVRWPLLSGRLRKKGVQKPKSRGDVVKVRLGSSTLE